MPSTLPLPITIEQAETFAFRATLWADAAKTTPIDLTGSTASVQFRRTADAADAIYSGGTANGDVSLGGIHGTVDWTITAAALLAMPAPFDGVYQFVVTAADATRTIYLEGPVRIKQAVTR